ncbi:unnamed protein product [Macrosiphum euphorbiae]|uniref:Uncharacterized protein n=1 Tax=Macrosiphum euphorbiae TaxID=13131 RepID=A0AAV0WM35_9HEMI|nr:unnamed protein product [Macrosiphum euphorbiae]
MLKSPTQGQPLKLQSKYHENSLKVIEKLPGDTYRVIAIDSARETVNVRHNGKFITTQIVEGDNDVGIDDDSTQGPQLSTEEGEVEGSTNNDNNIDIDAIEEYLLKKLSIKI